jgi:hypothetical protein
VRKIERGRLVLNAIILINLLIVKYLQRTKDW